MFVIPVIIVVIIVGVVSVLSISTNSLIDDSKEGMVESTLEGSGEEIEQGAKPPGRNLSIELEEKMGLSTP